MNVLVYKAFKLKAETLYMILEITVTLSLKLKVIRSCWVLL